MAKPFLTAAWRDLVLLSWRVDPALLAPHVPAGTDLDVAALYGSDWAGALAGKPNSGVNADGSGVEVFSGEII